MIRMSTFPSSRLWVLGASDPEMDQIARLLAECGEPVTYAVGPDGQRVHPGNAYRADRVSDDCPVESLEPGDVVYEVECALRPRIAGVEHITIDHHRPGDPGYGRPPEEFLPASSIGQVIAELARLGRLPDSWRPYGPGSRIEPGTVEWSEPDPEDADQRAYWSVCDSDGYWCEIPANIILCAAADHCLATAYRGECPGVDPDALMRWRIASRAAHQGRTEEEVLADVERAREVLRAAKEVVLLRSLCDWHGARPSAGGDCLNAEGNDWATEPCHYVVARDLRGQHVPELPEASAREGECFVADGLPGPDGRIKVVCQSGSPEQIEAFMRVWAPAHGLTDIYGDPARGFAGGYLADQAEKL